MRAEVPQAFGGGGEHDDVGFHEGGLDLVPELEIGGDGVPGEILAVLPFGGHGGGVLEPSGGQRDGVSAAVKVEGEGGAPGPGSKDGEVHEGKRLWTTSSR